MDLAQPEQLGPLVWLQIVSYELVQFPLVFRVLCKRQHQYWAGAMRRPLLNQYEERAWRDGPGAAPREALEAVLLRQAGQQEAAVARLSADLAKRDVYGRAASVRALAYLLRPSGPQALLPVVSAGLEDPDAFVRRKALQEAEQYVLARQSEGGDFQALVERCVTALDDESTFVRQQSLKLVKALGPGDWRVGRLLARQALTGPPRAKATALKAVCSNKDDWVRQGFLAAWDEAVPELRAQLQTAPAAEATAILAALEPLLLSPYELSVVELLLEALGHTQKGVRKHARRLLTALGQRQPTPVALALGSRCGESKTPDTRRTRDSALALLRDNAAAWSEPECLLKFAQPDWKLEVRLAAANALQVFAETCDASRDALKTLQLPDVLEKRSRPAGPKRKNGARCPPPENPSASALERSARPACRMAW